VTDLSLHLAPDAPAPWLALASLGLLALSLWAYRFVIPPLPSRARRLLPALRAVALVALAWLLAQPVLERARAGRSAHLVVLLDRSRSMELPSSPGGSPRAAEAAAAVEAIERAWRGRASVRVVPFAARLGAGSGAQGEPAAVGARGATALGDALASLPLAPEGQELDGVVVVSDGAVNAGQDPLAAARALGVPVHTVLTGVARGPDRAVTEVEASTTARVGEATPVRVHIATSEARGVAVTTRLLDGTRELGRATVLSPGAGLEAVAEMRVTPTRPGLAVWTARVDSLAGETSVANDARQAAIEVSPGRLGVLVVSAGLNWDLAFLRRALLGDSGVSLRTLTREGGGWREVESGRPVAGLGEPDLRGQAAIVLDAVAPADLGPAMDAALDGFVRGGGGLLALGGGAPGLARFRGGRLGQQLAFGIDPATPVRSGSPEPTAEASELLSWDDDPQRGEQAWRAAAPLSDLTPVATGGGDRVLIATRGGGPPLLVGRHVGRGQAMFVNGTGLWRWSLSGHDDLSAERGRRLWRRLVRWLAEPVQGEPLRLKPERWLTARGEPVRLFASLQSADFKPVAGATLGGEAQDASGHAIRLAFTPRAAGSYEATLEDPAPGRYRVTVRAAKGGVELGRAASEFAVDRWSAEEARAEPDSTTLAAIAAATGGRMAKAADVATWARSLSARAIARARSDSLRLWESPWVFALVVGLLSVEWAWRRRRGLP
jgi:hypothetical protein